MIVKVDFVDSVESWYSIDPTRYICTMKMSSTVFVVILGVILMTALFIKNTSSEKYYLRDIPDDLGYGGYPPELYGEPYEEGATYMRHGATGMYGAPMRYGESGYFPGAGLVW